MADQTIVYTEEMVGSGHPTKSDTLNRLAIVDHGTDGKHTLAGFQGSQFAADAEAGDTYAVTLSPVPAAYFTGMVVIFTANTANTGACTLNVNSLGAKTIKKMNDQDLETGEIEASQVVVVVYDGTNFQMVSQLGRYPGKVNAIGSIGGGAQDIDFSLGGTVTGTVDTSETTLTFSGEPASGLEGTIILILTNPGSQTLNLPASVDYVGGTAPSWTSSGVDVVGVLTTDGGTTHLLFEIGLDVQSP